MLLLASPVTRLHLGQGDLTAFPDSLDAVQAINLLNEKWPTGTDLTVDVVVTHAERTGDPGSAGPARRGDARHPRRLRAGDPPAERRRHGRWPDSYTLGGGQNDITNQDIVKQVRAARSCPTLFGGLRAQGVQALVSGDAAYTLDVVSFYVGRHAVGVPVRARALVPAAARRVPVGRDPDQGDPARTCFRRPPRTA